MLAHSRPFTYQLDSFAAAACAHFLLHSDYMDTISGADGWKPRAPLRRYWHTELWSKFFELILNVPDAGRQPDLAALADEMLCFLDSMPQRQKLRQALQSQHAALREAGLLKHRL